MPRVIVPVDFSETSLNAARFTAKMLAGKKEAVAILYNNYESDGDYDVVVGYQESLKREFLAIGVEKVEYENEMGGDLIENIARLALSSRATLIVMGITGKSEVRQAMFGSNTLKLVDKNLLPVMIVPPDAIYKGINNVVFTSDFKDVEATTPSALISTVLEIFHPMLHILNVSKGNHPTPPEDIQQGEIAFRKMFELFNTKFNYVTGTDFYESVDNFVKENDIDVLVTIPKHQSNAVSLFKSSHTKRLAYHSRIPILAAHE
ncbi:MAG: universal stress protein [Bacteroidota bacterium]|nr:universal stress protein [Bacteroidota bacterium]